MENSKEMAMGLGEKTLRYFFVDTYSITVCYICYIFPFSNI